MADASLTPSTTTPSPPPLTESERVALSSILVAMPHPTVVQGALRTAAQKGLDPRKLYDLAVRVAPSSLGPPPPPWEAVKPA